MFCTQNYSTLFTSDISLIFALSGHELFRSELFDSQICGPFYINFLISISIPMWLENVICVILAVVLYWDSFYISVCVFRWLRMWVLASVAGLGEMPTRGNESKVCSRLLWLTHVMIIVLQTRYVNCWGKTVKPPAVTADLFALLIL